MMRGFRERRSFAPVKEGEELDVQIESVGAKGDGVAKVKGFVLFIPNAKQGTTVRVRVTKVLRSVGFAEIVGAATEQKKTEEETSEEPTEETSEEPTEETSEEPEGEEGSYEDSEEF